MKRLLSLCIGILASWAGIAQTEEEIYLAWLDSVQQESYIAGEILLDDIVIQEKSEDANPWRHHYKKHNLMSTDQLMHFLPGVHMMRRGNFANEPMLRGMTSDRYLMSIDGMRIFGACTDKMDPVSSYVEPINLKSLDVQFGAQGSEIGASTGGHVDFQTKKPIFNSDKLFSGGANLNYGAVANNFDQSVDLNWSKERLAIRLSGVHRKADNYIDGDGNEVRYSQYEKFNFSTSLAVRLRKEHLLSIDYLGDHARDVGYPALPMDVAYARGKIAGIGYYLPKVWVFDEPEFKFYYNAVDHAMDDTQRDSVAMHMDMPGWTRTWGGFAKGSISIDHQSNLEIKADFYSTFARAEMTMYPNEPDGSEMFMLTWPDVHRNAGGFSGTYTRSINESVSLTAGLRWEMGNTFITSEFGERQLSVFGKSGMIDRFEWMHNYNLSLRYKVLEKTTLSVQGSYGQRFPTTSEQFGFYLFNRMDGYDYIGDPDIKKEKSTQLELDIRHSTRRFSVNFSVFGYWFDDYIMGIFTPDIGSMTPGALGVKWYENVPKARMTGGELSSSYALAKTITILGSIKYVYGEDFEGEPLPQMPPLKMNGTFRHEIGKFSWQPELEWSSAQQRISEKFNERKTSSYFLLNVRADYRLETRNGTYIFGGGIDNLTNTAYREHFDIGDVLRPGRNFYGQVSVRF